MLRCFARRTAISRWNTAYFVHPCLHNQEDPLHQRRLPFGLFRSQSTLTVCTAVWSALHEGLVLPYSDDKYMPTTGFEETVEHMLCRCPQYYSEIRVLATELSRLDNQPFHSRDHLRPSISTNDFAESDKGSFTFRERPTLRRRKKDDCVRASPLLSPPFRLPSLSSSQHPSLSAE